MSTPPILDHERIDRMRAGVMHGVDAEIRRRGRRTRLAAGFAGAAVIVLGTGAVLQLNQSEPSSTESTAVLPDHSRSNDSAQDMTERSPDASVMPEASPRDSEPMPAPDVERAIVTSGTVRVVVSDAADAAAELAEWVEVGGGRIDQRDDRSGSSALTIRVPAARVSATLAYLGELGSVESTSISHDDVTDQVVDLDARIDALQASVDRLTQLMMEATDTASVIEAESNLTSRQAELDGLRAQRAALGDQVTMSSLDVTLSQTPRAQSVEPDGFFGGLKTGWNSLVDTVNGAVQGVGVALPWIGILLLIGLVVATTRRLRR